jgi:hypothetical protein
MTTPKNDFPYVIVRTLCAGVFAGLLAKREGSEATILQARRLWSWAGAASLSQLAAEGTSKPAECRFPPIVSRVDVLGVIEVDYCTDEGRKSIEGVPPWRA